VRELLPSPSHSPKTVAETAVEVRPPR